MFVGLALLTMLLVRYVVSIPEDWSECPQVCQCKWISGKKTAYCREAGFNVIPTTLNSEMQVLDITGNSISHLPQDAFRSVGLIHLQRLHLKGAGIRYIHKDAFRELTILVEIDLSDNFISTLHPDTFTGNNRLRTIIMNGNPLNELKNAQFPSLPYLKSLEFQNCYIKYVHRDAFLNLPALESLSLKGNKLNYLSEMVFLPTPKLKTLVLDGNPWKCDCKLRNFRNWLLKSKLYSQPLVCTYPSESKDKHWEDVDASKFACAPNVTAVDSIVQGVLSGNVTLKCLVFGDPEPTVSWLFNGYILDNNTFIHDNLPMVEEKQADSKDQKLSLITLFNISDTSAGEYTCKGVNLRGESSINISLILPKEAVATTMKKDENLLKTYMVIVASVACVVLTLLVIILYHTHRCLSRRRRRRNKLKGATSFSDQDKKLLDVSITTTDRQTGSCEGFGSQPDLEMLEQSVQSLPSEMRDQPVHITIESHATDPSISLFPPPPEFSTSTLPHGAFGNIFISVSVGQEPLTSGPGSDSTRFPDLIDVARKGKVSVGTTNPAAESTTGSFFATLPRRSLQHRLKESEVLVSRNGSAGPQYDNMGPRITADGSSTISLPETISMEEIPTPPPPPSCSPMAVDYISL
ncbi:hypothetical protein V9T40_008997 [Parthenolecanium corni]|uniref:Ig-like domain-containing protein n=1 Tax=Parthenolecanium corni TaxID=536013 RepID=A0AAN9TP32_9HEMI